MNSNAKERSPCSPHEIRTLWVRTCSSHLPNITSMNQKLWTPCYRMITLDGTVRGSLPGWGAALREQLLSIVDDARSTRTGPTPFTEGPRRKITLDGLTESIAQLPKFQDWWGVKPLSPCFLCCACPLYLHIRNVTLWFCGSLYGAPEVYNQEQ
eukprot:286077-Amphidinium_carterae.1